MKITRAENGNIEHPQILMNAAGAQIFNTAVTLHPPSYNVNAQFITTTTAGGEMKQLSDYNMPSPAIANPNVTQSESQIQSQPANVSIFGSCDFHGRTGCIPHLKINVKSS
jgi:hypothetical protein